MFLYTFYPTFEKCYENVMCLLGSLCEQLSYGQRVIIASVQRIAGFRDWASSL